MGESARVLKYSLAIPVVLHGSVESYNDYKSYKRFYNKKDTSIWQKKI